jgi:hypothetical protein
VACPVMGLVAALPCLLSQILRMIKNVIIQEIRQLGLRREHQPVCKPSCSPLARTRQLTRARIRIISVVAESSIQRSHREIDDAGD